VNRLYLASDNSLDAARLERLHRAAGGGPLLIITHDNPDPDSLASGAALAEFMRAAWGIKSHLVYSGLVARAENQAMLQLLTPVWEHSDQLPGLQNYSAVALVDTQPGAGNNRLSSERLPDIVIDHHHPLREQLASVLYVDVRPEAGATSTLVFQYFEAAGIKINPVLATALFYGLHTDTLGLARGSSPADEIAYLNLLSLLDRELLVQVEQAGLSREYYRAFSRGLQAARLYGSAVIAYLGKMSRPDLTAEIADVLIRLETARTALCLGSHTGVLYFSLRTKRFGKDAGFLVQNLVAGMGKAGGHGTMAGGQVPLDARDPDVVVQEIKARFLKLVGEIAPGEPLLSEDR